jgi:hypothetical protein
MEKPKLKECYRKLLEETPKSREKEILDRFKSL